jgi:hypothetical protein
MDPVTEKELKDEKSFHVEDAISLKDQDPNTIKLNRTDFFEAQNDTLSEGRKPWPVIKDNIKLCMVVLAVQVSYHLSSTLLIVVGG